MKIDVLLNKSMTKLTISLTQTWHLIAECNNLVNLYGCMLIKKYLSEEINNNLQHRCKPTTECFKDTITIQILSIM